MSELICKYVVLFFAAEILAQVVLYQISLLLDRWGFWASLPQVAKKGIFLALSLGLPVGAYYLAQALACEGVPSLIEVFEIGLMAFLIYFGYNLNKLRHQRDGMEDLAHEQGMLANALEAERDEYSELFAEASTQLLEGTK